MIVDKPAWVAHRDEEQKAHPVYSVDVHPDGSRFATAGGDSKVRVWNLAPVVSAAAEADAYVPKLLATLANHAGGVTVVRFSHSGRRLVSASDDAAAIVYELRPGPPRNVFGAETPNLENWEARAAYRAPRAARRAPLSRARTHARQRPARQRRTSRPAPGRWCTCCARTQRR